MRHIISSILIVLLCYGTGYTQRNLKSSYKQKVEATWDQGVPFDSTDVYIKSLIYKLDQKTLLNASAELSKQDAIICREIAIAFYNRGLYDAADWYLARAKDYVEIIEIQPEQVKIKIPLSAQEQAKREATNAQIKSLEADIAFLENLPDNYHAISELKLKQLSEQIDNQIQRLTKDKQQLIRIKAHPKIINEKDKTIKNLEREKHVVDLTIHEVALQEEVKVAQTERNSLYYYIISLAAIAVVLFLITSYFLLRRRVAHKESVILREKDKFAEFESFVEQSVLVSKTDEKGRITYVNPKFEEVSGWTLAEAIGKDHYIVNSGFHPKEFWTEMYHVTVKEKKIWNAIVTNKNKSGELYWVDSYIKANFDTDGVLTGFASIRYDVTDVVKNAQEIDKKNTYLEHAAKILRHDMHSGINTYIPRGISSLTRRLDAESIAKLKLEAPLKMIREGLTHTQKVYKGVYEFTNLVKQDVVLEKTECNLKDILNSYLASTAYKSQVIIEDLPTIEVNEALFCTAIDNLIRNGLKYNDSATKFVRIYKENNHLIIQDNGRGLSQEEFEHLSKPYTRKQDQKEAGSGLGLNICVAILAEHGFTMSCEKNKIGTKLTINLKQND